MILAQAYNNRSLFSDYYLEELVRQDSHWQALKDKEWEYRQRISTVLEKALPGINSDTPEGEVEHRLIRPVLDVLGHIYFIQPSVPSPEGVRRPDYAFFPSAEARREAEAHRGRLEFFKTALAVGDAKAWERSLDKRLKGPGDPFANHNPSYQIDFYLRATDKRWGLLTNGRHWRLYHRDLSYRLDVYYEVDLPGVVALDEDSFLYFLAFFHKEALQPDATGESFLDRAYKASVDYAAKVSEELKDNVYEALRLLAEGFLVFPGNNLKPRYLDLVRDNAFILIYRLLFILYAEARELLPVANPTYTGTYSLRALARDIATKEPFESNLSPTTAVYWSRLRELFKLINDGDDFLGIPPYNGRLFDDEKAHPQLAAWKIGDRYLAGAIDQVARAKAAGRTGRGFVSYRDLSIRELGSIYEGLLEHRPRYATQDIAVVKDDKREKFVPLSELGNRRALRVYRAGSVYLETDKGERKATGSYYTPDYIVKYIVSNTLGPLLEEAKKSDGNLIDAILSLKVLDPAMGSGHFLVEATDFLARALVEALGADPREVEEDEIRWARREVVERCIYGVDLNPLAVDLAKLSLWLSTVSLHKPLNFLDHHLRCGNSLIGAKLEDLGQLPTMGKKKATKPAKASQSLLEYYFHQNVATAVDHYLRIAAISSDKLQDIRNKEKLYGVARDILKRYRDVADIWVSTYFGNEVPPDGYMSLQVKIRAPEPEWAELEKEPWFAEGIRIAEERHFFHWELEFPEVFFDRNGQRLQNPGFSAVVGNPPYEEAKPEFFACELSLWQSMFGETFRVNLWRLFVHRGLSLVAPKRRFSLIVPATLLGDPSAEKIRMSASESYRVLSVLKFTEETGVFEDVTQATCVFVLSRDIPGEENVVTARTTANLPSFIQGSVTEVTCQYNLVVTSAIYDYSWLILPDDLSYQLFWKLAALPQLKDATGDGFHTGEVQLDVYPRNVLTVQAEGAFPIVRGDNAFRYLLDLSQDRAKAVWFKPPLNFDRGCPTEPRLACRRTVNINDPERIQAIIVRGTKTEPVYLENGLNWSRPRRYDQFFVLAILNSALLNWFSKLLNTNNHVNAAELDRLPFRAIPFVTSPVERYRLVDEGKKLYHEYLRNNDWSMLARFIAERLPQKPDGTPDMEHEQSDVVHDLLAFLAEEMTRLHKEKQMEIKGFLRWLEGYLSISIDELKNKTKIKEYYKEDIGWDGFVESLKQNKRAIQSAKGFDITRREPQETIRSEFDRSVSKLKPILETIELTDKLIDQIVYKLYGLTEAEIAVVEGRS